MFLLDYLMDKLGYQKKTPWLFPVPKKAVKRVIKKTAVKKPRKLK
jgi:hypothetical protein